MLKKAIPIRFDMSVYKDLKLYAVQNDLTIGNAIKKLLEEIKKTKGELIK